MSATTTTQPPIVLQPGLLIFHYIAFQELLPEELRLRWGENRNVWLRGVMVILVEKEFVDFYTNSPSGTFLQLTPTNVVKKVARLTWIPVEIVSDLTDGEFDGNCVWFDGILPEIYHDWVEDISRKLYEEEIDLNSFREKYARIVFLGEKYDVFPREKPNGIHYEFLEENVNQYVLK